MRRWLAACLAVVPAASCSPFGSADTFACHDNGECNLGGQLGTCTNIVEPTGGTCVYGRGPDLDAPLAIDTARDAEHDGGAALCIGVTLNVCLQPPPTASRTLSGVFDTGSAGAGNGSCDQIQKQVGGPDLCVVAAIDWTLTSGLQITGGRPLVVVATDTLTATEVSASSGSAAGDGPDADDIGCDPLAAATGDSAGGTGGSFAGQGGLGGAGGNDTVSPAAPAITVTTIRGGCPGQSGGPGGGGGHSGGAIYLLAGSDMTIDGTLLADGSGGGGGAGAASNVDGGGGGGGGTGGFIGLEARTITGVNSATVVARAGAGGGGGGGTAGNTGGSGANGDAATTDRNQQVHGGKGGGQEGGDGGDADNASGDPGDAGNTKGGGGGGAGGIGVIWVTGSIQNVTTMPNATPK